jgi:antitoxin VapB
MSPSAGARSIVSKERQDEALRKIRLVREAILPGSDAVVLRSPANVAWLTAGGRTHMAMTPDVGVATIVVRADEVEIITANNEMPRLADEEIGIPGARWNVLPWSDDLTSALPSGKSVAADVPHRQAEDVGPALARLRAPLGSREIEAYRLLGRDVARSFTAIAERIRPDMSEYAATGLLAAEFAARGIDAILLLAAGGERLAVHRHPLPTLSPLGPLAMLVACGRRGGLIASVTRFYATKPLAPEMRGTYRRLLEVETAFFDATRPGAEIGAVWRAGTAAYERNGFPADEWTRHHQGGPSGYAPREYLANGSERETVLAGQAFGWNPSANGLKLEDTIISGEGGIEILTVDPAWPSLQVDGRARPDILEV